MCPHVHTGRTRHFQIQATGCLNCPTFASTRAARGNVTRNPRDIAGPHHGSATVAVLCGIHTHHTACLLHYLSCLNNAGVLTLPATADQNLPAPGLAGSIGQTASSKRDLLTGHDNLAAFLAAIGTERQQLAGNLHITCATAQPDFAISVRQGIGTHDPFLVDGGAQGLRGPIRREQHTTTIGGNQATVLDFGCGGGIKRNRYQSAATQFQPGTLASGQGHLSTRRQDTACVVYRGTNQGYQATLTCAELSQVGDCAARASECVAPGNEIIAG